MTGLAWEAALLARRGFWVFPVRAKAPMTPHGFRDAVGTAPEAFELFNQRRSATGFGIDCGRSKLLVVDLDGPVGASSWGALCDTHGDVETLEARTGREYGRHLYLHANDERARNSTGKIGPGIDTRGSGGYVLCPPSRHPSGRRYEWANNLPIADAPEWLLEMLKPPPPPEIGEPGSLPVGELASPYGRAALQGLRADVLTAPEGKLNITLHACARRAGRLEAAGELDAQLAKAELVDAAVRAGHPRIGAEKTFDSGFAFGRQYPVQRRARA